MRWNHSLAYFFGGAFLVNAVPHFVSGVTGTPFPSPFASPPGEGMSLPWVNVLWAAFNFALAYLLLARVGSFESRKTSHIGLAALGGLVMALFTAHHFGRVHGL